MIDLGLATSLKRAGLAWHPEPGDRFAVPQPELLGQVFTLSDMTIEVHQRAGGPVLGFNGTTEWALDSVQAADVVWLPAEHQLRTLLAGGFRGLRATADGFEVVTAIPGRGERAFRAPVAEDAYALALLALIRRATG